MSESTVGGSWTVRALAVDRASAFSGRCAPTATWVVEGYKSHPNQPIHAILIDSFHTQELGIHSYLLEQHFYTHQSLTSATKERSSKKELLMCV
jgi:hypothetical protein